MDLEKDEAVRLSMALMGESLATNRLLKILILTHPDPEALSVAWNASKEKWLERQRESPLNQLKSFGESFESSLAWISRSIEEAQQPAPKGAGIH